MNCREYLERHSEFMDGALDAAAEAEARAHAAGCASCARYDRVLRRGLEHLRGLEPVEPRLPARPVQVIREAEARPVPRAAAVGALGALAIAGVLAAIAWSPLFHALRPSAAPPGVASAPAAAPGGRAEAADPAATPVPARRPLLQGPEDRAYEAAVFPEQPVGAAVPDLQAVPPGPYSPLPLQPPDFGRPTILHDASAIYARPVE